VGGVWPLRNALSLAPRSGERVASESEPGEGLSPSTDAPSPDLPLAALRQVDLSPQAGRGEGETYPRFSGRKLRTVHLPWWMRQASP
jgi:hypothetical protein